LLTHTSGFASRSALERPTLDMYPLAARVSSYAMMPLESEPGAVYRYSGAGINTVARIVEVVAKMPFEDFLATRIFQPLGMKDTTFHPSAAQVARLVQAYRQDANRTGLEPVPIIALHYPLDAPERGVLPAGGLFSTAADLARFCQMILNGGTVGNRKYLTPASIHAMNGKRTPDSVSTWYGLGWVTGFGKDRAGLGHNGAYRTYMFIDPKLGVAGIFLIQRNGVWTTPEEKTIQPVFTQASYRLAGIEVALAELMEPDAAP
jgi:CubicO group peptidase (beta-lactamase class C family)